MNYPEGVTPPPPKLDVEETVKLFVELRDTKAKMQAKLKEDLKPYNEALEKLEALLLKYMQDVGAQSIKTAAGTAYTSTFRSATIKDRLAFEKFIIDNQLWDLADWKASKVQVFDYMEKNGTEVPGVNTSAVAVIGVRRGNEE